jgi:hypothetical protein
MSAYLLLFLWQHLTQLVLRSSLALFLFSLDFTGASHLFSSAVKPMHQLSPIIVVKGIVHRHLREIMLVRIVVTLTLGCVSLVELFLAYHNITFPPDVAAFSDVSFDNHTLA